jgi:hypothetical protein
VLRTVTYTWPVSLPVKEHRPIRPIQSLTGPGHLAGSTTISGLSYNQIASTCQYQQLSGAQDLLREMHIKSEDAQHGQSS